MTKPALALLLLLGACTTTEESSTAAKPSAPGAGEATKPSPAPTTAKKVVTLTSKSPEAIAEFEKGRDLLERARGPEAVPHFKKAAELDPDFALAHAHIALESFGDPALQKSIDAALAAAPKASEPERHWVEAIANTVKGNLAEAIVNLRKVTQLAPDDWHAGVAVGVTAQRNRRYPEATTAFTKVRELNPEVAMAWNGLAYTNAFQQKWDEAISAAKKQVELMPNEPNPHDTLGEVLLMAGKLEEAEAAFQKAFEINPKFGIALQGVALARAYKGDFKGAHEMAAKALALPDTPPVGRAEIQFDDSWLTLAEGKPGPAIAMLAAIEKDPALKDGPFPIFARLQRAQMNDWLGKPKDAQKALAEAATALQSAKLPNQDRAQSFVDAGKVILSAKAGKPDAQALAAFDAQAQQRPEDRELRETKYLVHGLVAAAKGDAKAAATELAKCDALNIECQYERWLLQKKAGDKMGADLTAKQIAATHVRNAAAVWVSKQVAAPTK